MRLSAACAEQRKGLFKAATIGGLGCVLLLWAMAAHAKTGIIVARTDTFAAIKNLLSNVSVQDHAGRQYAAGTYGKRGIVLVRSPMGKVNNALTTQILLSRFEIDSVISIAPAGAVAEGLEAGTIILAAKVFQHDFGTEKPYGFIWSKAPDGHGWTEEGYHAHLQREPLQRKLQRLAAREGWPLAVGTVVSGDQFITCRSKRAWLQKKFDAAAVDMSAAAIVQTCFANRVVCAIIRVITDQADESARSDFEASFHAGGLWPDPRKLFRALTANTDS